MVIFANIYTLLNKYGSLIIPAKEYVKELEREEAKAKHKKDMIKVKRIIANSIKDQLISQVSSKNTPKEIFDALTNICEGKNINQRMTLRNQLRGVKVQKKKTMQSYFSRVSHIKEQLESIGDMVEEDEFVMTTLNGLPIEWDSFIIRIRVRRKLTKFIKLWEECVQEEGRIENREENINENIYQALATHTKKGRNKRKDRGSPPRRS